MRVTKVTKKYYVVNGEKVYFFEPIKISKRAMQILLNQSEQIVKSINCGMCRKYIKCKKDVRVFTSACNDFVPSKKQLWKTIKEMNSDDKRNLHETSTRYKKRKQLYNKNRGQKNTPLGLRDGQKKKGG